ncbi:MAG: short-chain fatty acyl-CoA regulator family protein [Blastomonas sp.]
MTMPKRIFAGNRLRALRQRLSLNQHDMAVQLGISASYLSQIEHDERPVTTSVLTALAQRFPLDMEEFQSDAPVRLMGDLQTALADPVLAGGHIDPQLLSKWQQGQPEMAQMFVDMHTAYRQLNERMQTLDDMLGGIATGPGRLPWEEVRDWFHDAGNYIDILDRQAEAIADGLDDGPSEAGLAALLQHRHGISVEALSSQDASNRFSRFDPAAGRLWLSTALPPETRYFLIAHRLAAIEMRDPIAAIAASADLKSEEARKLVAVGLANYAAGAIVMPYRRFRSAALECRHDIERLCRFFSISFEQACHRLSTLQRPGARGVPFFFCRVDMAGNITKRHSATRLQFARFGGACPLWIVHEAVAIPDRILVQLAETPDGIRYVSMAKGLVKPSGRYTRSPRRYAVALGCEAEHARHFIYADGLDLSEQAIATPIGISCRTCPRRDCDQRAFPPTDRQLRIDPLRRDVVPYEFG